MPNAPRPLDPRLLAVALVAALAACGGSGPPAASGAAAAPAANPGPTVMRSEVEISPALRDLPSTPPDLERRVVPIGRVPKAEAFAGGRVAAEAPAPAAAAQTTTPVTPVLTFEGMGDGFPGFTVTGAPPDPNGDVGPHHLVEAVNVGLTVFDKSGRVLKGPVDIGGSAGGLFAGSNLGVGLCASSGQGDPVVLYDRLADRWFVTQFAFKDVSGVPVAPFYQCVAVSTSGDPTGQWYLYAFGPFQWSGADAFQDYGKFGVWPDAYYATYNAFGGSGFQTFQGTLACAMDRAAMLAGQPDAAQICEPIPGVGGTLPATLGGPTPPPAGTPGIVATFDVGQLQLWRYHPDFGNPSASTIDASPLVLQVPGYLLACPSRTTDFDCVVQPDTATRLDAMGDRLLPPLAYRNYGDHEALVAAHAVDADGSKTTDPVAIRWYELRNAPGSTLAASPQVYQSGTVAAADGNFRWMASAALDGAGDLALGYSLSGPSVHPAIALSARLPADPPGSLGAERVVFAGAGSQTVSTKGTPLDRWGDYTSTTVDPADDCTLWHVNQYQPADGAFNWHTRVAAAQVAACAPASGYGFAVVASAPVRTGCDTTTTLAIRAIDAQGNTRTTYAGPVFVTTDDPRAVVPAPFSLVAGQGSAQVILRTPGDVHVFARDLSNLSERGEATVTVALGAIGAVVVSGVPASWGAWRTFPISVQRLDVCGNADTGWQGPVNVAASDPAAVVGAATFAGGVASVPVQLKTTGTQTITATDPASGLSGSATTTVGAGSIASLGIAGLPATAQVGTALPFTVEALDAGGNFVANFAGTVNVTSTDPNAAAAPVTVSSGTGQGTITFGTAGAQTVTVADAANATIRGTATVEATAAPAKRSGCGCGTGSTAGWAALLPLAALFAPRRRRTAAR